MSSSCANKFSCSIVTGKDFLDIPHTQKMHQVIWNVIYGNAVAAGHGFNMLIANVHSVSEGKDLCNHP